MGQLALGNLKTSLAYVAALMWAELGVAASVLSIGSGEGSLELFGYRIPVDAVEIVAPIVLIVIILMRRVIIANAAFIVSNLNRESKREAKELIETYPLLEFMRWRSDQPFLLTVFQVAVQFGPALTMVLLVPKIEIIPHIDLNFVVGIGLALLEEGNYSTLRKTVYELLVGPVKSPD